MLLTICHRPYGFSESLGLGRSIALGLAEDGFSLALNDLLSKKDILEDLQAQILKSYSDKHPGQKCMITTGDVSSEEDVKRMVEEAVEELGSLDVVRHLYRLS